MKETPILFTGEMVRAILDGRKSKTRRLKNLARVNQNPDAWKFTRFVKGNEKDRPLVSSVKWAEFQNPDPIHGGNEHAKLPYGFIGDRLWVKETFQIWQPTGSVGDEWIGDEVMEMDGRLPKEDPKWLMWNIAYRAGGPDLCHWWRPSIFMPRWASRILLEITGVRVERLHDITHDDVLAEGIRQSEPDKFYLAPLDGVPDFPWTNAVPAFASLWNSINEKRGYGWDRNPWVWVYEFKRIDNGLAKYEALKREAEAINEEMEQVTKDELSKLFDKGAYE